MHRKTILMSPADSKIYSFFERQYNVIQSDYIEKMITFERHHADMQLLNLNGKLFINSSCTNVIKKISEFNLEYIICEDVGFEYPSNVALNAALVGNKLFCNRKALHSSVTKHCDITGIEILNVKQGYAKCSMLILNENNIITDDESIYKTAIKSNINVLKIEKGDIYLDKENYGFIGGASARIGNMVYFFGNINTHKNSDKIIKFIEKCNMDIICVSNGNLRDIGGIVEIK